MRPSADLTKELLSIAVPGLKELATQKTEPFNHDLPLHTKQELLQQWDDDTPKITEWFNRIPAERYPETYKLFGQYEFTVINHILYFY